MKKILITLGLCTSLTFAEIYYNNKDFKHDDRNKKYNDRNKVKDQIHVNGYISRISKWKNYSVITIKLRNGDKIKAKVGSDEGYLENDIVRGRCVNYKRGRYERCSLDVR